MVESVLDDVPGLGEVRRKALLRHFGSLKKLRGRVRRRDRRRCRASGRAPPRRSSPRLPPRPAAHPAVNTATGEIIDDSVRSEAGRSGDLSPVAVAAGKDGPWAIGSELIDRHGHERGRPEHRGQGARGPGLVRHRQPAAQLLPDVVELVSDARAARCRRSPWSSTSASGGSSPTSGAIAELAEPASDPGCCSSRRPTTCWYAARRRPGVRTRCRAGRGCSTGSSASASWCATCAARPTS